MTDNFRWQGWSAGLALMSVPLALATLPPFVDGAWHIMLMQAFAPICHQIAERSFHVDGVALAVCHRCYGIYWGLFAGLALYLMVRRWGWKLWAYSRPLLLLALVPIGVDWTLDFAGLWHNTPLSRMSSGSVFGLAAGLLVAQAFASIGFGPLRSTQARNSH